MIAFQDFKIIEAAIIMFLQRHRDRVAATSFETVSSSSNWDANPPCSPILRSRSSSEPPSRCGASSIAPRRFRSSSRRTDVAKRSPA